MKERLAKKYLLSALAIAIASLGLWCCQTAANSGGAAAAPAGATAVPPKADEEKPAGQRIVYASHSLMWDVPDIMTEEVKAYGIKEHVVLGVQRNGFSTTAAMWQGGQQSKGWMQNKCDIFVTSPMEMPDTGVDNYVAYGLQQNPKMRFFIQNNWAGFNMDGNLAGRMMGRGAKPWDQTTVEDLKTLNTTCEKAFNDQIKKINEKYKADEKIAREVAFIIPTSEANTELRKLIIEKKFPGLDKQSDLFADNIGHPKPVLWTFNSYIHFACIYGKSPVGLAMPTVLKRANNPKFDEDFNKRLQELAWKNVLEHPLSGVKAPAAAK
jgi:hypothetical protein